MSSIVSFKYSPKMGCEQIRKKTVANIECVEIALRSLYSSDSVENPPSIEEIVAKCEQLESQGLSDKIFNCFQKNTNNFFDDLQEVLIDLLVMRCKTMNVLEVKSLISDLSIVFTQDDILKDLSSQDPLIGVYKLMEKDPSNIDGIREKFIAELSSIQVKKEREETLLLLNYLVKGCDMDPIGALLTASMFPVEPAALESLYLAKVKEFEERYGESLNETIDRETKNGSNVTRYKSECQAVWEELKDRVNENNERRYFDSDPVKRKEQYLVFAIRFIEVNLAVDSLQTCFFNQMDECLGVCYTGWEQRISQMEQGVGKSHYKPTLMALEAAKNARRALVDKFVQRYIPKMRPDRDGRIPYDAKQSVHVLEKGRAAVNDIYHLGFSSRALHGEQGNKLNIDLDSLNQAMEAGFAEIFVNSLEERLSGMDKVSRETLFFDLVLAYKNQVEKDSFFLIDPLVEAQGLKNQLEQCVVIEEEGDIEKAISELKRIKNKLAQYIDCSSLNVMKGEDFEALKADVSRFCKETYPALVAEKNTVLLNDVLISNPLFGAIALGVWLKTLKVKNLETANPLGRILTWLEGHELSCSMKHDLSLQLKEYLDNNFATLTFKEWNEIRSAIALAGISELTDIFIEYTIPRLQNASWLERGGFIKELVSMGRGELVEDLIPPEISRLCSRAIDGGMWDSLSFILASKGPCMEALHLHLLHEKAVSEASKSNDMEMLAELLNEHRDLFTENDMGYDRLDFYKLSIMNRASYGVDVESRKMMFKGVLVSAIQQGDTRVLLKLEKMSLELIDKDIRSQAVLALTSSSKLDESAILWLLSDEISLEAKFAVCNSTLFNHEDVASALLTRAGLSANLSTSSSLYHAMIVLSDDSFFSFREQSAEIASLALIEALQNKDNECVTWLMNCVISKRIDLNEGLCGVLTEILTKGCDNEMLVDLLKTQRITGILLQSLIPKLKELLQDENLLKEKVSLLLYHMEPSEKAQVLTSMSWEEDELNCILDAITEGQDGELKSVYSELRRDDCSNMIYCLFDVSDKWMCAFQDVVDKENTIMFKYLIDKHRAKLTVENRLHFAMQISTKNSRDMFDELMENDSEIDAASIQNVINMYLKEENGQTVVTAFIEMRLGSKFTAAISDQITGNPLTLLVSKWLEWALSPSKSRTEDMRDEGLIYATRSSILMETMKEELENVSEELLLRAVKEALNTRNYENARMLIKRCSNKIEELTEEMKKTLLIEAVKENDTDLLSLFDKNPPRVSSFDSTQKVCILQAATIHNYQTLASRFAAVALDDTNNTEKQMRGLREALIVTAVNHHPDDLALLKILLPDGFRFPSKKLRNQVVLDLEDGDVKEHLKKCTRSWSLMRWLLSCFSSR